MELTATTRNPKTKATAIREMGLLPAVIFGKDITPVSITIKNLDFKRVFTQAGESTIVDLKIEGDKEPRPVLVSEIQYHPLSGKAIHVGFHQVALGEKVVVPVPVVIHGESPAVKGGLGVLLILLQEIEVEAYPRDLPKEFVVEVENLTEAGQSIHIKDLKIDPKVEIKVDKEELVVKIDYLEKEEEEPVAAVSEAEAVSSVQATKELTEEEKKAREAAKKTEKKE